jgi:hypothetical protein
VGVGRGCLGVVWMGGHGSGVETQCGWELYQGVVGVAWLGGGGCLGGGIFFRCRYVVTDVR